MNHVGIDLGGRESQVCVRSDAGEIQHEGKLSTGALGAWLAEIPHSRVVMESCAEAFRVAALARDAGHVVNVVPATLVRSLGIGARRVKTDKRDARLQSELSCRMARLPSVHVPSESNQELRSLLSMRQTLMRGRTMLINSVRGFLRGKLLRLGRGTPITFPARVRQLLQEKLGELPVLVSGTLSVIDTLNEQLRAADAELLRRVKQSAVCRRLMTAPGVGPVTAAAFMSALDDPHRFPSARAVASYLGLTPGEHSSSDRQRRTGLTKAGPSLLRSALTQGAWVVLRQRTDDPLVRWAKEVGARRSKKIAVCALARKLAVILWAMWRDERDYEPGHKRA
jgi:transposase